MFRGGQKGGHAWYNRTPMNVNRLLEAVGATAIAGFVLIAYTPLPNVLGHQLAVPEEMAPSDAIVVLGAGMSADGKLSQPSLARAVRGIEPHQLGYAPLLVLLGPATEEGYASEAKVRWRLARTMRVDPSDIILEARGMTTREEATLMSERLGERGIHQILLVTETQHLIRSKELFENAGFQVFAAAADSYSVDPRGPWGRLQLMKRIMEEQAARIYYRAAGYL
jgi:uncharacterized SAM-binding protein YcdF (DUF218 family)